MGPKLSTADAHAVDLLVNEASATRTSTSHNFHKPHAAANAQRLENVGRVLSLIKQAPVDEPPADLAARTLRRIAALQGTMPATDQNSASVGHRGHA